MGSTDKTMIDITKLSSIASHSKRILRKSIFPRTQSLPNGRTHPQFSDYVEQIHASHITCYHNFYHMEKNQPASGESTIMIMENVNDSKEISVALCSEGNICCSFVFV